jgi:uracil-DNA glycosylase
MTLSEEIDACQECRNLASYGRLETDDKPYLVFRVDKNWKPPDRSVNVLFIAESPPWDRNGKQPYFYNDGDERHAGLRKEVLKHLNLEHLEEFRDKGYFLIDAIKCRLSKKDKSSVPSAVLERCSSKFLGREIRVLKPKVIFVLGNSAKTALQGLLVVTEFSDFKELINHKVTDEFDKMLSGYRVILCVYPGGQTRMHEQSIRRSFSKIAHNPQGVDKS